MLTEYGTVVEVNGSLATVKVGKHEECAGCGACGGASDKRIVCDNGIGAKVKDKVRFEMAEENVVLGAFMVFIFPLIWAGMGGVIAYYCIPEYITEISVIFFLISLIFVKMYDTHKRKSMASVKITEIL